MTAAPHGRLPTDRSPWSWLIVGGLVGLMVALVLWAPARWLAAGLRLVSQDRVQLQDVQGTVWEGSARLALSGGRGSTDALAMPGRLSWELRPSTSGLRARLRADCCTPQGLDILLTPLGQQAGRLTLTDHQSRWPASLLAGLGTPWNTLALQGDLLLDSRRLTLTWTSGQLTVDGQLQLDALDMSSRLSTLRPMGSYRIQLTGTDTPTLDLSTLDGSLQLSGHGRWTGQRMRFEGEASAAPERLDALSNLLHILGRRVGDRSIIKLG